VAIKNIIVNITIISDNIEFTFKEDYTEYAQVLIDCNNIFHDTGVPMTESNILDYFHDGHFKEEDIKNLNGNHFLFGFLESLGQSDEFPDVLYSYKGKLEYKTKMI
jgi:hypothetical protein